MAVTTSPLGTSNSTSGDAPADSQKTHTFAFSLVTTLFFMFGFITCLNDILVPHLKTLFDLDYTRASLVQFCFFGAFFLISLPAGRVLNRFGYQGGAAIGLITTAFGCCLFYPAAAAQSYPLFLFGLFVLASGVTIIQVAVNPYVALLGPSQTASVRLNLAQAFNSLGTTLAPLLGSIFILGVAVLKPAELAALSPNALAAYRAEQAQSVQMPYIGLALVLFLLALTIGFAKLPKFKVADQGGSLLDFNGALKSRRLVLGAVAIFAYVGAEVAVGSYMINFLGLREIWGLSESTAGHYVALYWGGAMLGRFIGSAALKKIAPPKVLMFNTAAAAVLVGVSVASTGSVAAWALIAVGLFNSIMFPTVFTLAIEGLGENTPQGSSLLCMAIVGGAILPVIQGFLADGIGLHTSLLLPVICYAIVFIYGRLTSKGALASPQRG